MMEEWLGGENQLDSILEILKAKQPPWPLTDMQTSNRRPPCYSAKLIKM